MRRRDGNENVRKRNNNNNNRFRRKTATLEVHYTFLYISVLFFFLKLHNFAFYRGRKQVTTKSLFLFRHLGRDPWHSTSARGVRLLLVK